MSESDVLQKAKMAIEEFKRCGPTEPIVMIGLPRVDNNYPTDVNMSLAYPGNCTRCKAPVWTTQVKEKIKELMPDAELLCGLCLERYVLPHQHELISV